MLNKIKKHIPENIKIKLSLLKVSKCDTYWISKVDKTQKNIFVFLAGFYQNLGDMALTYSQTAFLKKLYPDANVVAIPSTSTYQSIKTLKKHISHDDIITIIGGGNMDDMYKSLEAARLHVIKSFPNNRIISFPQTMAFSDTKFGEKMRNISYKVYSKHKHFTLFVREPNSLERVKKHFKGVEIGYCPDIVLSLNKVEPICERTDVVCCLRADKEQNLSDVERQQIIDNIKSVFPDAQFTDTVNVALDECTPERYAQTLENFWTKLRKSRVVITDRLHCMIFCAITGTPCVVFDNSNHKISGVYNQWMNDISYIKLFANDEKDLALQEAKNLYATDFNITNFDLSEKFGELTKAVLNYE